MPLCMEIAVISLKKETFQMWILDTCMSNRLKTWTNILCYMYIYNMHCTPIRFQIFCIICKTLWFILFLLYKNQPWLTDLQMYKFKSIRFQAPNKTEMVLHYSRKVVCTKTIIAYGTKFQELLDSIYELIILMEIKFEF